MVSFCERRRQLEKRRWGVQLGYEDWRVPEVDVDELNFPVGLGGYVKERRRDEQKERAAEEIVSVEISVLIIIIPGVFFIDTPEIRFLVCRERSGGGTGRVEMARACFEMAAPGRNEIWVILCGESPENTEMKYFLYSLCFWRMYRVEGSGETFLREGCRVLHASGLRGCDWMVRGRE